MLQELASFIIPAAHAQISADLSTIVSIVAGPYLNAGCSGPECIVMLGLSIMDALKPLIGVIAVLMIVQAGFTLVYRGSDEELSRAKNKIAATLTAVALFFLSPRLVDIFYGGISFGGPGTTLDDPGGHGGLLTTEVLGFVSWLLVIVAVGGVTMIIVSGLRTMMSLGSEEGTAQLKRTVGGVAAGILLITSSIAIIETLGLTGGAPTAAPVIIRAVQIINGVLLLATIITVAVVVYAGLTMIFFVGDEEKFGSAKNLIIRALIGLGIILVSWITVNFVIAVVAG